MALLSRLYDDEKYVDKIVGSFTELANMYNTVTANCNKNAETINPISNWRKSDMQQ